MFARKIPSVNKFKFIFHNPTVKPLFILQDRFSIHLNANFIVFSLDTNDIFSPQYFHQQQQQQVTITYPYNSPSFVQQTVAIDNTFKESESINIIGFLRRTLVMQVLSCLINLPHRSC